MKTRRHNSLRKKNHRKTTHKNKTVRKCQTGKKWTISIKTAKNTLAKTGSVELANNHRTQNFTNSRLFLNSMRHRSIY
jgi:hypothetical protein